VKKALEGLVNGKGKKADSREQGEQTADRWQTSRSESSEGRRGELRANLTGVVAADGGKDFNCGDTSEPRPATQKVE
jgi:hypothetical protein